MYTELVELLVLENLEKHIHSVLNKMFIIFLQLNVILKCLFPLLLHTQSRWLKINLLVFTLKQKTGVGTMNWIIAMDIEKVEMVIIITSVVVIIIKRIIITKTEIKTVIKNLVITRKMAIRKVEKVREIINLRDHILILQNWKDFLMKNA